MSGKDNEANDDEICHRCGRKRSAHKRGHVSVFSTKADDVVREGFTSSLADCLCKGGFVSHLTDQKIYT